VLAELRHGDATQSERRWIVAQADALERAERVANGKRARGGSDQRIHRDRLLQGGWPSRRGGDKSTPAKNIKTAIARARGMTQVARDAGLSRESLYKALSESGNPSYATILKVARALHIRLHALAA
jgi:probable addiction module antidote protein